MENQQEEPKQGVDRREFLRKTIGALKGFALITFMASALPQLVLAHDSNCNNTAYTPDSNCGTSGDVDNNCGNGRPATGYESGKDKDDNCGKSTAHTTKDQDNNCGKADQGPLGADKDENCGNATLGGGKDKDDSCGMLLPPPYGFDPDGP